MGQGETISEGAFVQLDLGEDRHRTPWLFDAALNKLKVKKGEPYIKATRLGDGNSASLSRAEAGRSSLSTQELDEHSGLLFALLSDKQSKQWRVGALGALEATNAVLRANPARVRG